MFMMRMGWARARPGRNMASTRGADIVKARVNAVVVVVVGWRESKWSCLLQVVANALLKIEPSHLQPTRAERTTSQLHSNTNTHTSSHLPPPGYSPPYATSLQPPAAPPSATMSDENDSGEERVTMPFKFVTGKFSKPHLESQWPNANLQ
jgi:hypothetical protein